MDPADDAYEDDLARLVDRVLDSLGHERRGRLVVFRPRPPTGAQGVAEVADERFGAVEPGTPATN